MTDEKQACEQIVEIGRRMHAAGMAPGQDGNISVRLGDGEVLITPSRAAKGYLKPSHMVRVDLQGKTTGGDLTPSVETPMHLAAYRSFPAISACIHAHPAFTVVLSMAGISLSTNVLPEIATIFGEDIPVASYVTPGTEEMGTVLIPLLRTSRVVVQERHGLFSTGADLFDTWYRTEQVEACARVLFYAHQLGCITELPAAEVARLKDLNSRIPATPRE